MLKIYWFNLKYLKTKRFRLTKKSSSASTKLLKLKTLCSQAVP